MTSKSSQKTILKLQQKLSEAKTVIAELKERPRMIDLSSCESRVRELEAETGRHDAAKCIAETRITELEADIKEWESGAVTRGWRKEWEARQTTKEHG